MPFRDMPHQVVIHKEVHGVGHGGYDCDAGASNWMQGWRPGKKIRLKMDGFCVSVCVFLSFGWL